MDVLYREYDEIMVGNRKNFSRIFFNKSGKSSMRTALKLMRYSFENYLPSYSPRELYNIINADIIEDLNLKRLMKHIEFDSNTYFGDDQYKYLITLVYPEEFKEEKLNQLLNLYHKLLNGKIKKIPKEFFIETEGLYRAVVFLREAIRLELDPKSIYEYYDFFNSPDINSFMEKMRLTSISKHLFNSHLEYLHYALGEDRDTAYFEAIEYKNQLDELTNNTNKGSEK